VVNRAVMAVRSTLWLGRVCVPGERRHRSVRIWTDGEPPGPEDLVEEIDDPFSRARPSEGGAVGAHAAVLVRELPALEGGLRRALGGLELVPPVRPGKIVCVGRNYRAHAREMGNEVPAEPLLFFKPGSALQASEQPIVLPRGYERIDMEAELVAVIGRGGRYTTRDDARALVAGYTLGNDVSCRDLQKRDKQWTRAKGFDTFAPLGPFVRMVGEAADHPPDDARIRGLVDGELRQDAPLGDMMFDLPAVLAYLAEVMTLEPGDLVYTGTPAGVSRLEPGRTCEVQLEGWSLGRLVNPVVAEERPRDDGSDEGARR
jgi:2-keto-4-pentenoate hydratase/2-oxohepta-3-ene-1,7-dioic acid hydratase in catechol pathway